MKTRFRVMAPLEMASRLQAGTVTIDRVTGFVEVRPLRKRRVYMTTLAQIASWVVRTTIRMELAEKKKLKKRRKR